MRHLGVLVVEDEVLLRRYTISLLNRRGCHTIGETSYGETAVEMNHKLLPDLILMDIRLKGRMNGIEAARKISQDSQTPILFMTAYDYLEQVKNEKIPNTLGFMNKPVDDIELDFYLNKIDCQ